MGSQSKIVSEATAATPPPADMAVRNVSPGAALEPSVPGPRRRRRWWRGPLVVLIVGAGLYWFRVPILQSIAGYLVVDEPFAKADYVLVQPYGDKRYDRAAELYRSGQAASILLVERRPKRLERLGFEPSFETVTRRALAARGVPANSITVVPGKAGSDWERAHFLREWLEQQPAVRIVVLCDRLGGRKLRHIFDQILGREYASRISLIALPERSYGENDWWQHREAIVDVFDTYVRLAFTRLHGESKEEGREWDPREYEKSLRR